jgi:SAM-dependent MidA family methyltransferase
VPDELAQQRSLQLQQHIKQVCGQPDGRHGGRIRFSEFMNMALYQPGLGYYSGGLQKFGQRGDFITAPEVSPLFGQCLANQVAEVLRKVRTTMNDPGVIIEFGAGSGVLAADILLALEVLDELPEKYLILDLSAELQQRQQQTLKQNAPHLFDRVQWLRRLPDDISSAVVIANEVLDAMPVECFRVASVDEDGQCEAVESLLVGVEDNRLVSAYVRPEQPGDEAVNEKIQRMQQRSELVFTEGYCSEYNPAVSAWLSALSDRIETLIVLLIDYGYDEKTYYHPDRTNGSLMCYYQHHAHDDYLWWPGLQDITAFVNFTDVAYCAVDCGLSVSGYTTQAAFLLANGLTDLHEEQVTDDVQQQIKLSQQIKTLTLPSEMGDRFKVMALTKNYGQTLQGFSMLDLRNRL